MSTMTATVRGTSSLSITPTQNTAPVLEFRCLFTHDLRKKKKTWHDGKLRFHTFNKRVMVYDDSKNYIGDLHRRDTEELQEGEELKLDKGVLVEVGEQLGTTQTDLAPLLEKRRLEHGSSPARPPLQQISNSAALRSTLAYSQGRPKSLASVLGASQGVSGRARIPVKSPCEQRYQPQAVASVPPVREETPAKRMKLSKERASVVDVNVYNTNERPHQAVRPAGPLQPVRALPSLFRETLLPRTKDIVVTSSDNHGFEHPPPIAFPIATIERNSAKRVSRGRDKPQQPQEAARQEALLQSRIAAPKDRSPRPKTRTVPITLPPQCSAKDAASAMFAERYKQPNAVVTNCLHLTNTKPRKKLMYGDLLPSSKQDQGSTLGKPTNDHIRRRSGHFPGRSSTTEEDRTEEPIDLISDEEDQSPMSSWLDSPARVQSKAALKEVEKVSQMSESPMFLSQLPAQNIIMDAFVSPLRDFAPLPDVPPHRFRATKKQKDRNVVQMEASKAEPAKMTLDSPRQVSNSKLKGLDQRLLMQPPLPVVSQAQASPQSRPLRRVLSENDSAAQRNENVDTEVAPYQTNHKTSPPASRSLTGSIAIRSPIKLQRSVSDTSALRKSRQAAANLPSVENVGQEMGPWTGKEAYLLFDWWPTTHEKPIYGQLL